MCDMEKFFNDNNLGGPFICFFIIAVSVALNMPWSW